MGRSYAGILGTLAWGATLVRGLLFGVSPDTALFHGWLALLLFAPLGAALGTLAEWIVDQSVQQMIDQELAAQQSSATTAPGA